MNKISEEVVEKVAVAMINQTRKANGLEPIESITRMFGFDADKWKADARAGIECLLSSGELMTREQYINDVSTAVQSVAVERIDEVVLRADVEQLVRDARIASLRCGLGESEIKALLETALAPFKTGGGDD